MHDLLLPVLMLAMPGGPSVAVEAIDYFPAHTAALIELAGTESWLNRKHLDQLTLAAESSGFLAKEDAEEIKQALVIGGFFVGQDAVDAAGILSAKGLAAGWLDGKHWGVVMQGSNASLLDSLRMKAFVILEANAGEDIDLSRQHGEYLDFDYWELGEELAVGVHGPTLVLASNLGTLKGMLDVGASESAGMPKGQFQGAHIQARIDRVELSKRLAKYKDLGSVFANLLEAPHFPSVQFLLGPGLAKIGACSELAMGVTFQEHGVEVSLRGSGAGASNGLEPKPGAHARQLLEAGDLLSLSVYRDLDTIIGHRDELFPVRRLPKFSKALSDLGQLFGGMEIEEDLLPGIGPWMEVAVGEIDFGTRAVPDLALPGAVLVMEVDAQLERALVTAFQTGVGLVNANLAQKGEAGYALGLSLVEGVLVSSASLPPPGAGLAVDRRYNLEPAVAFVEGHFLIGTHSALVGAAVLELQGNKPTPDVGESLHLDGQALGELLASSRSALVMQSVLEDGLGIEAAEAKWDSIESVLELLKELDFGVGYLDGGGVELKLELGLVRAWTEAKR